MQRILEQEQNSKFIDELIYLMKFNPSGFMVKDLTEFITNLRKLQIRKNKETYNFKFFLDLL